MAATTGRDRETCPRRVADGDRNVFRVRRADDHFRPVINSRVMHLPAFVVSSGLSCKQLACQLCPQSLEVEFRVGLCVGHFFPLVMFCELMIRPGQGKTSLML